MKTVNIAILGFGTIGGGLADCIDSNAELIEKQLGARINIKYILDLRDFPEHRYGDRVIHDIKPIIEDKDVSIVAEMMGGSHPAYDFSVAAMNAGKSVVTSNKEVVANFGIELLECAKKNHVRYLFEASVGGGIPVIRTLTEALKGTEVCEIYGILNGTTNYILTEMDKRGISMEEALSEAQALGYAEADPTADVEGIDARRKICILAAIAYGVLIPSELVTTEGITGITKSDVEYARRNNCSVKLVAHAVKTEEGIYLSVSPMAVSNDNPLAGVNGVFNAVMIRGNTLGNIMLYGAGAGSLPTASAVLADIMDIASFGDSQPGQFSWVRSDCIIKELKDENKNGDLRILGKDAALNN
ncbi:MAG: homoserine dehydrogenase [Clostridia bacterium]|nr:homoserine dehydrogenase [Clostridia bacterium]